MNSVFFSLNQTGNQICFSAHLCSWDLILKFILKYRYKGEEKANAIFYNGKKKSVFVEFCILICF